MKKEKKRYINKFIENQNFLTKSEEDKKKELIKKKEEEKKIREKEYLLKKNIEEEQGKKEIEEIKNLRLLNQNFEILKIEKEKNKYMNDLDYYRNLCGNK